MKFWPFRSSIETRADEPPDDSVADTDAVLHALWSGASSGSVAVTGAEALRVPAVANAVRVISEAAATLDVRIMERDAQGVETEDREHPIGILLRGDVNPWSAGFDLIRDLTADALTRDWGGLAYVNRVRGELREIVRYQPAAISVQYDPWTAEPTYRIEGKLVDARNIVHVRGSFDRSPLSLAAEAIGVARQMEKHAGNFFRNGAVPSVVVLNKTVPGTSGAKKQIKGWKETFSGPEASGRTAFLWEDATIQQLALNSVDSQFLELRKFQILEIANAFRVPPSMLYQLDRATWSNSEQMGREFLTYTLEPWLRSLETALGRALLTREERRRFRISFDRDDLTRADLTARATAISTLVSSEVLNKNEGRDWLGLGPRAGGEEFGNPNINPKADGGVPKAGATPPKPDDEAANGPE